MKRAVFVDLNNLAWDQHGVYSLSASLRAAGVETGFVGTRDVRRALSALEAMNPDFLLYSSVAANVGVYREFDRLAKARLKVVSVIGGPGPTYSWEDVAGSTIDAVCLGEGEEALTGFVTEGRADRNLFLTKDGPNAEFYPFVRLDDLPFPDREVIYRADPLLLNAPSKQFLSGRGCPYRCTYCFNHRFNKLFGGCGSPIRKKSVDYLIEEIKGVRGRYPLRTVVFQDDTFVHDRDWFHEFAERFPREVGLPYTCNVRADLMTPEMADALKASGCVNVSWSIETGDEGVRNRVLRRNMRDEQIRRTARLLHERGMRFRVSNILGLPGEPVEGMLRTLEMNIEVAPYLGMANIFVPFPGLDLTNFAEEGGFYEPLPQERLPKTFFTETVLNYTVEEKSFIAKLVSLFPLLVTFPLLYRNRVLRALLFGLPKILQRALFHGVWTFKMSRMFTGGTPLRQQARMGVRYLRNL